jgi:hypothetical protein
MATAACAAPKRRAGGSVMARGSSKGASTLGSTAREVRSEVVVRHSRGERMLE